MADIVLDLNKEDLPFENDSIDYIYSSHALEHLTLDGFLHIMDEMYRTIKDDGQICITVPYFMTRSSLANPFHNNQICFNEHTFRFFSSVAENKNIDKRDYYVASCPQWGLRYSANAENEIEFETLEINYTYFDEYKNLTIDEQRIARSKYLNVVDTITYYLKAIKPVPLTIIKTSNIGADSYEILVDEKIKYLEEQIKYHITQTDYIKEHNLDILDSVNNIFYNPFKKYSTMQNGGGDGLYIDKNNIIKPASLVLFLIQDFVDKNQIIINDLQRTINGE